jgi:hypothetical protein
MRDEIQFTLQDRLYGECDEFAARFPMPEDLRSFVLRCRFRNGFDCLHCGGFRLVPGDGLVYTCADCTWKQSLTSGTAMDNRRLSMETFVRGMWDLARDHCLTTPAAIKATLGIRHTHHARRFARDLQGMMVPLPTQLLENPPYLHIVPWDAKRAPVKTPVAGVLMAADFYGRAYMVALHDLQPETLCAAINKVATASSEAWGDRDWRQEIPAHSWELIRRAEGVVRNAFNGPIGLDTLQGSLNEVAFRERGGSFDECPIGRPSERLFESLVTFCLRPRVPAPSVPQCPRWPYLKAMNNRSLRRLQKLPAPAPAPLRRKPWPHAYSPDEIEGCCPEAMEIIAKGKPCSIPCPRCSQGHADLLEVYS